MDYTPPVSSVHGIIQARLELIAISSSRGSNLTSYVSCIGRQVFLPLVPPWKPKLTNLCRINFDLNKCRKNFDLVDKELVIMLKILLDLEMSFS